MNISAKYLGLEGLPTINFGDTGTFNASPISCTFWLTLPFLVRIVLSASVRLFCLLCLVPVFSWPFHTVPFNALSLLGIQRSEEDGPFEKPFALVGLKGYEYCPSGSSIWSGNFSIEVRALVLVSPGNLKLGMRVAEVARVE
jgi:hypothetical protein